MSAISFNQKWKKRFLIFGPNQQQQQRCLRKQTTGRLFPLTFLSDFNFKPAVCSCVALPLIKKSFAKEKQDYKNAFCILLFARLLFLHSCLFPHSTPTRIKSSALPFEKGCTFLPAHCSHALPPTPWIKVVGNRWGNDYGGVGAHSYAWVGAY